MGVHPIPPAGAIHGRSQDFFRGEHFSKILEKFLRKLRKRIIFAYFSKSLTNHALIFCAFGRKTQIVGKYFENFWWKFYRKMEFLIIFGNFVAKNGAFGKNTIFLQHFFGFFGGGDSPPFPLATPLYSPEARLKYRKIWKCEKMEINYRNPLGEKNFTYI